VDKRGQGQVARESIPARPAISLPPDL